MLVILTTLHLMPIIPTNIQTQQKVTIMKIKNISKASAKMPVENSINKIR